MTRFKNKTLAALLAALGGLFGLHRFYLNGSGSWIPWSYPAYFFVVLGFALRHLLILHPDLGTDFISFLHPALLAAFLPAIVGLGEAVRFALTPDATWDAHWNSTARHASQSGALVIVIAIVSLAVGATAVLSMLAISIQGYFEDTL